MVAMSTTAASQASQASRTTRQASRKRRTPLSAEERRQHGKIFRVNPTGQRSERRSGLAPAEVEQMREQALSGADSLTMLHAEASARDLLSAAQERELISRAQSGDQTARTQVVEANVRLVSKIMHYYAPGARVGCEPEDLMQEGMLGLLHAIDLFDPQAGTRFSTYATLWIRQRISRALIDKGATIRTPAFMTQRQRLLARLRADFEAQTGHLLSAEELATQSGLEVAQVQEALALSGALLAPVSLDQRSHDNGGSVHRPSVTTLGDLQPDPNADDAFEEIERRIDLVNLPDPDSVTAIMRAIAARPRDARTGRDWAREMEIVLRRYLHGQTLDEIAPTLHMSRERVRQLGDAGLREIHKERKRIQTQMTQMRQDEEREKGRLA